MISWKLTVAIHNKWLEAQERSLSHSTTRAPHYACLPAIMAMPRVQLAADWLLSPPVGGAEESEALRSAGLVYIKRGAGEREKQI